MKHLSLLAFLIPTLLLAEAEHEEIGKRIVPKVESSEDEMQQKQANFIYDRFPMVYVGNDVHTLVAVSALGDSVEIEDGSVWKVSTYDGFKAKGWRSSDPLTITQNHSWFSSYTYRIVNRNTGASIDANLFLGPFTNGAYSRYVQSIDLTQGLVTLTDNTHWEVSDSDKSTFRNWMANDSVIIGVNTGWDSACEGLLINVTTNNHVRAHQF